MSLTIIIAAAVAAVVATFGTLLFDHHGRADLQDRIFDLEQDLGLLTVAQEEDSTRMNRLWQELNQAKHRINADLVEHNHRLNRHRAKLVTDYDRFNAHGQLLDVHAGNLRALRVAEQENRDHLNEIEQDHNP